MFRLTRQVRFAVNAAPDEQLTDKPANSYAGHPSLTGFGQYLGLAVTLTGELRPQSSYLRNIKDIDDAVRRIGVPLFQQHVRGNGRPPDVLVEVSRAMENAWPGATLESLRLSLSPYLALSLRTEDSPMIRLSQKFEFSASHRLFDRALSESENQKIFGKCSNPNGHGHNYELQVTVAGEPHSIDRLLINLPNFERIVSSAVIDRLDHKNLNVDVPDFAGVLPSVENIARIIYKLLKPRLREVGATLSAVTVWETPKTWCEYSEPANTGATPAFLPTLPM